MSERRILILNTDLERGGTPTVVRDVATRLNAPGVHVQVACLGRRGPLADEIEAAGLTVTALGACGPTDLRVINTLSGLIGGGGFDTVLSFLVHANAAATLTSFRHSRVRYFQAIQTTQRRPAWHWWVQAAVQGRAERIIVPSQSVADCAHVRSLVGRRRIVVIPNAVDVDRFQRIARIAAAGEFRLGFIGRLDPVKHVPNLVTAMSRIEARVALHIFGDGPDRARIEQTVARLGLSGRVTLHGMVACPEDALSQIDAIILPSEAEGLPMVLIEAMAAGVPIIATDAPGIRDVVQNGRTALMVPVGDVAALASAIGRLAGDVGLRDQLVAEARVTVAQRFTWERVMSQYGKVLQLT